MERRLRHAFFLTIAVATFAACSDDTGTGPSAGGLQGLVDSLARAHDLPGLVVAVRGAGDEASVIASGRAELASGRRMTTRDRFRIGSITKPMVATVVLQLVDEGLLSLDDSVAHFLPGLLPDGGRITIRQLLNHTAGLADYIDDQGFIDAVFTQPSRVWTPHELVAIGDAMPRSFTPGAADRWDYSNTNYIVLGLVAEAVGDQPIAELLEDRVFEPLGMTSTFFATAPSLPAPFAQGYVDLIGLDDFVVGTLVSPTVAGAAGAVVSTAEDVLRFVEALAAGELVSAASHVASLTTVPASRVYVPGESIEFGYGLGVLAGDGWVGHDGAIPGYEAEAYAKTGVGSVVVLLNKSTTDFAVLPIAVTIRDRTFASQ
jgi:D-alanyl-D-alanine carboxypeptidase